MYSDLNLEMSLLAGERGSYLREKKEDGISVTTTNIATDEEAERLGRRKGFYATIVDKLPVTESKKNDSVVKLLSKYLAKILSENRVTEGRVLVAGLGNFGMTADALGNAVTERMIVGEGEHFDVCCISPSVAGVTGIESFDVIKGVVDRIRPSAVVAVDALSTRSPERLCSCFQITSAGIQPGSGVGNAKRLLSEDALGVPVIGVGVPLVARGEAVSAYYFEKAAKELGADEDLIVSFGNEIKKHSDGLIVTPKDVDTAVEMSAEVIASALNLYFFGVRDKA